MASAPIEDVADTAFWIAHYRAEESDRPDALFNDPLARRLAGERGRTIALAMPSPRMTRWQAVVRTCIIDDLILGLVRAGEVDTVLNLGAGLDTRPYRMDLPASLRWVEVDQHAIIDFKTRTLEGQTPRCALERHTANLADGPERREALERLCPAGRKILVLTEGVVPYLSNDDVAALAEDLRAKPSIVGWIAEYFSQRVLEYRAKRMARATENAPFLFRPTDWFAFFEGHGWTQQEARFLPIEGQRLGRPFPGPFVVRAMMRVAKLLGPKAKASALQSMGYVLYAPSAARSTGSFATG